MYIDPWIVKLSCAIIAILISMLGYFLIRTLHKQDENNKEQSQTNQKLTESIGILNQTMITINEGFRWMKEGCAERHININHRLKTYSDRIGKLEQV
jgi:hypothetical protein